MESHLNWSEPFKLHPIDSNEVHVYRLSLDQVEQVSELWTTLSSDEQERANRFVTEKLKNDFVGCRGYLRKLLTQYLNVSASEIEFQYGKNGKPELAETHKSALRFNVTHSGRLALIAICQHFDIGIDIEKRRSLADMHALVKRYFSNDEYDQLMSLPSEQQLTAYFKGWTQKEALVKALGSGIAEDLPLADFTVDMDPSQSAQLVHIRNSTDDAKAYQLITLTPHSDYQAALAVVNSDSITVRPYVIPMT